MSSKIVPPHGGSLKPLLLKGEDLKDTQQKAENLPQVRMSSRETSDLIMMATGAFLAYPDHSFRFQTTSRQSTPKLRNCSDRFRFK